MLANAYYVYKHAQNGKEKHIRKLISSELQSYLLVIYYLSLTSRFLRQTVLNARPVGWFSAINRRHHIQSISKYETSKKRGNLPVSHFRSAVRDPRILITYQLADSTMLPTIRNIINSIRYCYLQSSRHSSFGPTSTSEN